MKIIADMHCHTIASTHAYSTVLENIKYASSMGLYALAITDHARSMKGSPGAWYFENLRVLPKFMDNVLIVKGIEANVLDATGKLDVDEELASQLDWVVASIHDCTFTRTRNVEECTNAWMNIAKDPKVNVIGHSGVEEFKYDYENVIKEFGYNGKLVEINNSSFKVRKDSHSNCKEIAKLCKKHSVNVILNSDSHFCTHVGHMERSIELLKEIDFPQELVVNSDINRFKKYLRDFTKIEID